MLEDEGQSFTVSKSPFAELSQIAVFARQSQLTAIRFF